MILEEDLPGQAAVTGEFLLKSFKEIQSRYPQYLIDVRGKGLLIGLEFIDNEFGYSIASGLFRRGVLVAGTLLNSKVIRIEPALNISRELLAEVLNVFEGTMKDLTS